MQPQSNMQEPNSGGFTLYSLWTCQHGDATPPRAKRRHLGRRIRIEARPLEEGNTHAHAKGGNGPDGRNVRWRNLLAPLLRLRPVVGGGLVQDAIHHQATEVRRLAEITDVHAREIEQLRHSSAAVRQ